MLQCYHMGMVVKHHDEWFLVFSLLMGEEAEMIFGRDYYFDMPHVYPGPN